MKNGKRRRGLRRTVQLLLVLGLSISVLLSFAYTVFAQYIRVTFPDDFYVSAGDFIVQSNGDIVVPGYLPWCGGSNLTFFHGDGSLNTDLGADGSVVTNLGDFVEDEYLGICNDRPIAVQSDDKIILQSNSGSYRHLVRYNFDGSLDTSFDASVVLPPITISTITVQPDDKIIVAGIESVSVYALGRFNADGTPDTTFDGDGWLTTDPDESGTIKSVALLSNGNIVAAGTIGGDFAVAVYNHDGSPDTSFAENGVLATDFAGGFDFARSLAVQSDDKIIVAGQSEQGSTLEDFAVARYNPDGTLDTSFSDDGLLTTDFNGGDDYIESITIQPDGKIVVAGETRLPFDNDRLTADLALARYLPDGELDTSFGVGGKETFDFTDLSGIPSCCNRDHALKVALGTDGTIAVLGRSEPVAAPIQEVMLLIPGNSNQAPEVEVDSAGLTIDEGQDAANSGIVSDSDGDAVTLAASAGTVTNHDDGTWSWNYTPGDGPADSQTVSIVAEDGNGNTAQATFELIVHNVAPIVNAGPDMAIISGETLAVSATFTDPGPFDTHSATIDFGSGDGPEAAPVVEGSGLGAVIGSRQYMTPGDYEIEVCVTDDDAGSGCDSQLLTVRPLAVFIDIKPGSDSNCINNDGNGVIPVAILSDSGFDATQVNPTTVSLDGQGVGIVGKGKTQAYFEDINLDGLDDLILQIEDADGTYEAGDTIATLAGTIFGGSQIMGTDSICIRP